MNLYEMSVEFRKITEAMEETGVSEEVIKDTLDSLDMPFDEKAENIAKLLRSLEAEETVFRNESKRLSEKAKSLANRQKSLKGYLESCMRLAKRTKFKTGMFSFNIQRNKQAVEIIDPTKIPLEYRINQEPKIDKKALYADLKAGEEIPGVELKESESLRIR